jgi:hypothetical protein
MTETLRTTGGGLSARCPTRLGESCTLCFPGATGPQDCGLVHLVMQDKDLRAELARMRAEERRRTGSNARPTGHLSVR